jgi:hypothetical protein
LLELYQQGWLAATDVQTLVESVYSYTLQMAMVAPSFAPMTAWVHRLRRLASSRALEQSSPCSRWARLLWVWIRGGSWWRWRLLGERSDGNKEILHAVAIAVVTGVEGRLEFTVDAGDVFGLNRSFWLEV